ncbi:nuclear polyadenylated RNA-binding protein 4 [Scheffersomyces amazonensis]|uniref:nuclear polyadenylated RNA-binding protein 4 n=1 Tax=Scheffersomyces amazonensis TaxID=1078765 RepID=UPI00315D181B
MSTYEDDEALFEDIYGEDDTTEQKPTEEKPKEEAQVDATSASYSSVPETTPSVNDAPAEQQAVGGQFQLPPQPPVPQAQPSVGSSQSTPAFDPSQLPVPPPQSIPGFPPVPQFDPSTGQPLPPPPLPPTIPQHQPSNVGKESGKMFIGGLNWDTTEEGLVEYFSKYGEVIDYTIMKDSNTGRSRGFGFLTFKEPSSVDEVIKTDHILDGKLIDPKRAIAREEQDKVGKIFVGGIDPMVNEKEFNDFFSQFGSIIDAQLMIDKDTGRSRGFGFITYDSPDAVDRVTVNKYLTLKGKAMEVKRAEPRGQHQQNQLAAQQQQQQQQQYNYAYGSGQYGQQYPGAAQMTPEMVQYYQRMQQWYMYQQQAAAAQAAGQPFAGQPPAVPGSEGSQTPSDGQPSQPLNPQAQSDEPEAEAETESNYESERRSSSGEGYNENPHRDQRRLNLPKGPKRAPPTGPSGGRGGSGGSRGRGGFQKRSRGYHPYRGGRR